MERLHCFKRTLSKTFESGIKKKNLSGKKLMGVFLIGEIDCF